MGNSAFTALDVLENGSYPNGFLEIGENVTIITGIWEATPIKVQWGGTGNTTFTPYSIICSGTTGVGSFQNVSGVGATDQILMSMGASALPAWSTATYPATTTVNQILYSSSANTITGLATANNGVLITSSGGVPSIGTTLPTGVQTNITELGTITTGVWNGSLIPLAYGGTNANLTASNGGIFYSTASAGAVLAGTATADRVLLSGSSTTPSWSTATYPATTTANQILYSSSANTITGLATANNGVLLTSGSGVPSIGTATVSVGGTGNTTFTAYSVLCGGTTSTGSFQNVSGVGTSGQVLTSNGASSLPTWQSSVSSTWVNQTSTSVTMAVNTSYLANASTLVTLTLPSTAAQGVEFAVAGVGSGGWKIAQAVGQQINFGNVATTLGTAGFLSSSNQYDVVYLVCTAANTQFQVINSIGNPNYN